MQFSPLYMHGFGSVFRWYIMKQLPGRSLNVQMKRLLCLVLVLCLLPAVSLAKGLSQGSQGKKVLSLQNRLIALGQNAGNPDGIYGVQTTAAVKEAQRLLAEAGYSVSITGNADEETLRLLFDPDAEEALLTLRFGCKGSRVTQLQNRLIDLKLLLGMADGDFGSRTRNAVTLFQQKMTDLGVEGLETDGAATPKLMELLMSDLSLYGFDAPIYFDQTQPLSLTEADLYSASCILLDAPTGEVLFSLQPDEQLYPASTTKILTLLTALRHGNLDQTVTIPKSAADIPSDSSIVPIYPGETMTLRDLLYGLMIRSGNDAANAIAELCAGNVEDFVGEMNALAQEIGMNHSHFVNPHGYHDENHYSTARDLAYAARLGLTDPLFCEIVTCLQYTMPATKKRDAWLIENTNEIFNPSSAYFIPGAAGVKSGYTSLAGFCYVGAAQRNGRTLIAVILNAPGRNRGWLDLSKLFEYGFAL